jgi:hypothetical protein
MPMGSTIIGIVGDLQRTLPAERMFMHREQNDAARLKLLEDMVTMRVGAVLIAGDLVDWGALAESWAYFDELFATLHSRGTPVLPALGNHDYFGVNAQARPISGQGFLGSRLTNRTRAFGGWSESSGSTRMRAPSVTRRGVPAR